ncbi:MAG: hypothetical protein ACI841_001793 [Planctomycetota bacterium]|jgi:hypothetical protein
MKSRHLILALSALMAPSGFAEKMTWKTGELQLKSAGALAFGEAGVLFIGDAEGANVTAIDTGDKTPVSQPRDLNVIDLAAPIAQMTGSSSDEIKVHDLAVNLISGQAYLTATRGGGDSAIALLVRVGGPDDIEVMDLASLPHMRLDLADAPKAGNGGRRDPRGMSVTDLGFHDGMLYVAGLSNEEFASKLRIFAFPFDGEDRGTSVEVYHGAHGAWETRSPIRTFLPMAIEGEAHLVAGYTCTPLVTFPVKALQADAKLRGKTVAELGNRNTPLDMVLYKKDGADFLLIANTSRGVMKVSTAGLAKQAEITTRISDKAGLKYETIEDLTDVTQLAGLDDKRALMLFEADGLVSLEAIELP